MCLLFLTILTLFLRRLIEKYTHSEFLDTVVSFVPYFAEYLFLSVSNTGEPADNNKEGVYHD